MHDVVPLHVHLANRNIEFEKVEKESKNNGAFSIRGAVKICSLHSVLKLNGMKCAIVSMCRNALERRDWQLVVVHRSCFVFLWRAHFFIHIDSTRERHSSIKRSISPNVVSNSNTCTGKSDSNGSECIQLSRQHLNILYPFVIFSPVPANCYS